MDEELELDGLELSVLEEEVLLGLVEVDAVD